VDLVFLFGPPAVGKLTIARALAERTGLKLFHNHLVLDAVTAVFDFRSPGYIRLRESIWLDIFAAAATEGVSLIFTFVPETTLSPSFPERVRSAVEGGGGRVRFVELTAPIAVQEQRIALPSRAEFAKLMSLDQMRDLRAQGWLNYPMPAPEVMIDTGRLSPPEAAAAIAQALALSRAAP
jgi:hypothetical protein